VADWNERYRQGEHLHDEPHPLVLQFAARLRPRKALDLACGAGRHALCLAEHGWQVTAVDASSVAIQILEQRAAERNVRIDCRIADLEKREFLIEPGSYDLIILCNYLQRDLFPSIRLGTRIGGVVIAVIAMFDDDPQVKPMNPAFLLKPGELRAAFMDWDLLWYFEGKSGPEPRRATAEIAASNRTASAAETHFAIEHPPH
jgi:tellurite methyltransferase